MVLEETEGAVRSAISRVKRFRNSSWKKAVPESADLCLMASEATIREQVNKKFVCRVRGYIENAVSLLQAAFL